MDWEFITDEILESLEANSITTSNIDNLDRIVLSFVSKLKNKYKEENFTSDIDSELTLDLDEIDIF